MTPHEGKGIRTFETGANRSSEERKLDYEGFLSPQVLRVFAEFMNHHRRLPDGSLRASDNWQKGIPVEAYMKSAFRHFMEWWTWHRRTPSGEQDDNTTNIVFALCALIFNAQGYLHEMIKENGLEEMIESGKRRESRPDPINAAAVAVYINAVRQRSI